MKGFVYLDVLFASLLTIIALIIGMQLLSNVIIANHSNAGNLGEAVLSVSERVINACYENGGIAACDLDYVHVGLIDENVFKSYSFPRDVLDYGAENNYTFKIGFDNDRISGVYCLIRLLKHKDEAREVIVRICGE